MILKHVLWHIETFYDIKTYFVVGRYVLLYGDRFMILRQVLGHGDRFDGTVTDLVVQRKIL
jgi:hypothetical protein